MGCTLSHKSNTFMVLTWRLPWITELLPTQTLFQQNRWMLYFDFHSNIQTRNRNNVERFSPMEYTYFQNRFLVTAHTSLAFILSRVRISATVNNCGLRIWSRFIWIFTVITTVITNLHLHLWLFWTSSVRRLLHCPSSPYLTLHCP
jgi:hypothetical protein